MTVDLYRDYESLEKPPPIEGRNPADFRAWCWRRQADLARLERVGDYIQGGSRRWEALLTVAYLYGWQPQGTELGLPGWSGTYFSNDGQRVSGADAAALAAALQRVLASERPVSVVVERWTALPGHSDLFDDATFGDMAQELLGSRAARAELERWVRFLERGSFVIW